MFDWNPYGYWCTDFRVVIHDDPYYYPVYRYRGDRVVYTRPLAPRSPMFEFKARAVGEPATPLIRTRQGSGSGMRGRGPGPGVTRRPAPAGQLAPAARVPRLREPLRPSASERSDAAPSPAGRAPAEVSVRPGRRIPPVPAEPPPGAAEARMPVERGDSVTRPGPVNGRVAGRPLLGQPRAGVLAPIPPGGGGPPAQDAPARAAGERSGMAVPAGDRGAEGRDERPVLRRRPEPPEADSTRRPAVRPRIPSAGRPPPTAGRPPVSTGRPPASADPVRSPGTRPPAARSGPPPRS